MDRRTLAGLIPLAAICIALAEFSFDRTQPRWWSPWFWAALAATVGLLVAVQILRFVKSSPRTPSKPDDSSRTVIRRPSSLDR